MVKRVLTTIVVGAFAGVSTKGADIALPDGLLHGVVNVDGTAVPSTEDLTIFATAEGQEEPIAAYRMGDLPAAGDRYVLRFQYSLLEDGQTPSAASAQAGQVVRVYAKRSDGSNVLVADAVVPASGEAQELGLSASGADLDAGQEAPSAGKRNRHREGLCGLLGLGMPLSLCSLLVMKLQRRH